MENNLKKPVGKKRLKSEKSSLLPIKPAPSADVEKVLEHISSPYRWELLEVEPVKPRIPSANKSARH